MSGMAITSNVVGDKFGVTAIRRSGWDGPDGMWKLMIGRTSFPLLFHAEINLVPSKKLRYGDGWRRRRRRSLRNKCDECGANCLPPSAQAARANYTRRTRGGATFSKTMSRSKFILPLFGNLAGPAPHTVLTAMDFYSHGPQFKYSLRTYSPIMFETPLKRLEVFPEKF
ncbi:MAG TPA: hypothetical protein VIC84_01495 [Blastocatellia bacterium]|jgi:hypothetical protein